MVRILVRKLSCTSEKNTWQNMLCTNCLLFYRSKSILRRIRDPGFERGRLWWAVFLPLR